jgi:hypothetical protein
LGGSLKVEDNCDDVEMPGSWLNIGFDPHHGDRRASEQIFIKPFRERVTASVERRGQLNVLEVARRLGFPAPKAREVAEALAQERGWQTEKGRRKLILRKPAAAPAQG